MKKILAFTLIFVLSLIVSLLYGCGIENYYAAQTPDGVESDVPVFNYITFNKAA